MRFFSFFHRSAMAGPARRAVSSVSLTAALVLTVCPMVTHAQTSDPANDFLATYVGPQNADVDVLSAQVTFTGTSFVLSATMNGNILNNGVPNTPGATYVWGFDRGQGTARFAAIAPGVLFDSVVVLRPDTTVTVNRIVGGPPATNFGVGTAIINGATISATIAASELPLLSPGFASQEQFTWNLWPRVGAGNNNQISDFAPNNSNVPVTSVAPEAGSLALLALGGVGFAAMVRVRRRSTR